MKDIETAKGEIVMYQPDETIRLEKRLLSSISLQASCVSTR